MKVSLGMKLRSGPWGGGNQFLHALARYLRDKDVQVSFDLEATDLDIILLFDPRPQSLSASYQHREIVNYLLRRNWRAVIVHRVNECDERKGTTDVNKTLIHANLCADCTVFVSTWLKDLFLEQGMPCELYSVIPNGSDRAIFHSKGYRRWDKREPMRLVTHHWSGNWMKGFDIYQRLDELLATEPYEGKISFTYIGNLPKGFQFHNASYIEPLQGKDLATIIRQHHVYLTASQNEPGSNHQNEGANCGLPLLYRESGCMPEYCNGFGVSFTAENFERKLQEMMNTYDRWVDRMSDYPYTAERTCEAYYDLFIQLLERREESLKRRKWWRRPIWLLRTWAGR
jgi:hypothetical protein